jgi:hypothetical protein
LLGLFHYAQGVAAENFANVSVGVAFADEGFGDFRQLGSIFHALGHIGAIEIGAETHMVGADELYEMIEVINNFLPANVGQLSVRDELLYELGLSL